MRTLKYIIVGVLMLSLSFSSMSNLLGQRESIEFLETYTYSEISSRLDPSDQFFQLINTDQTDPESSDLGSCEATKSQEVWKHLHTKDFQNQLPEDAKFAWGVNEKEGNLTLFALRKSNKGGRGPNQSDILDVSVQKDQLNQGYNMLISFSEKGAEEWEVLTGNNIDRSIAFVIEGKVYMAPTVREKIKHGKCMISGEFSKDELSRLKKLLEKPIG